MVRGWTHLILEVTGQRWRSWWVPLTNVGCAGMLRFPLLYFFNTLVVTRNGQIFYWPYNNLIFWPTSWLCQHVKIVCRFFKKLNINHNVETLVSLFYNGLFVFFRLWRRWPIWKNVWRILTMNWVTLKYFSNTTPPISSLFYDLYWNPSSLQSMLVRTGIKVYNVTYVIWKFHVQEKWFPYHNSLTIRHTMTILHTQCVAHDLRRTPIDFGVKRFNVKIGYCDSPVLVD